MGNKKRKQALRRRIDDLEAQIAGLAAIAASVDNTRHHADDLHAAICRVDARIGSARSDWTARIGDVAKAVDELDGRVKGLSTASDAHGRKIADHEHRLGKIADLASLDEHLARHIDDTARRLDALADSVDDLGRGERTTDEQISNIGALLVNLARRSSHHKCVHKGCVKWVARDDRGTGLFIVPNVSACWDHAVPVMLERNWTAASIVKAFYEVAPPAVLSHLHLKIAALPTPGLVAEASKQHALLAGKASVA